jgi:hypothetical protein
LVVVGESQLTRLSTLNQPIFKAATDQNHLVGICIFCYKGCYPVLAGCLRRVETQLLFDLHSQFEEIQLKILDG